MRSLILVRNRYSPSMNTLENLLWNAGQVVRTMCQVLRYAFTFLLALLQPKTVLAARLLAAESQLAICKHRIQQKKDPRPRFTSAFRLLWTILSKSANAWQAWTHLMQPATVKRWHTTAFRLYWRWKSRTKLGRRPISDEMQELIRKLSRENLLWGAGQIRDTLRGGLALPWPSWNSFRLVAGFEAPSGSTMSQA